MEKRRLLGSFPIWLGIRALHIFVLLYCVRGFVTQDEEVLGIFFHWDRMLGFFVFLFFLIRFTGAEAYGYANDEGVFFRRFLKLHFVPWNEVKTVQWRSLIRPRLRVSFKLSVFPYRPWKANFELITANTLGLSPISVGRTKPELVVWIEEQIRAARKAKLKEKFPRPLGI